MSVEPTPQTSKTCPTCGTRLNDNAARCLVCGRSFTSTQQAGGKSQGVQNSRVPEITLSLPVALGLMVLVLAIGAGVVFTVLRSTGQVVQPTPTSSPTTTATTTLTPTASQTASPYPTATSLPPLEYTIQEIQSQGNITIPNSQVYCMPEGINEEQLQPKRQWLIQECVNRGYNYAERLHIIAYGDKRGV